jgi:hypothetical protein
MPATGEGWYAANATRYWPLDDAATARADDGSMLPPGILVDINVRFPAAMGNYLVLSGITVTPNLVTAIFSTTTGPASAPDGAQDASTWTPCAAVTIPQPAEPGRMYPVDALAPGVAGWIVLGDAIDTPYTGRFSTAAQGQILASLAGPYAPPHVTSLGRHGTAGPLTGAVTLRAGQDLSITVGSATIQPIPGSGGAPMTVTNAIFIGLVDTLGRDAATLYASGQERPESGTCPKPPLEELAGVSPDCAGMLTLQIVGMTAKAVAGGHGVVLELARGLSATCPGDKLPDQAGRVEGDGADLCGPGIIPTTPIDATICNPGPAPHPPAPPPPSSPPPPTPHAVVPTGPSDSCLRIYDDFRSIPFAPAGTWSSSDNMALGTWTAGVESTPSVLFYTGGPTMLTKIAAGGALCLDTFIKHPPCPAGVDTVLGWSAFALMRPHAGANAGAGLAINRRPDNSYYRAVWDASASLLAIDHVGGSTVTRLASTVVNSSTFAVGSWAQLEVGVSTSLGAVNISALLSTPADAFIAPAGRRGILLGHAVPSAEFGIPDPATTGGRYLPDGPFGLVTPGGGASFAYFFAHAEGS